MARARSTAAAGAGLLLILLLGLLLGAMAAILPPGLMLIPMLPVVIITGLVFWTLPAMRRVPYPTFKRFFFLTIAALTCMAPYVAIDPPGLPWISFNRVILGATAVLFLICIGGSPELSRDLRDAYRGGRPISSFVAAVLVTYVLAIPLAHAVISAISGVAWQAAYWYLPFAMALLAIRSDADVRRLLVLLTGTAIFLFGIAVWEFMIEQRVYLYITHSSMFADNPIMNAVTGAKYRSGQYRTAGSFIVSLSLAEYLALVAPLCLYVMVASEKLRMRLFGAIGYLSTVGGILLTGTRGGVICLIIGTGAAGFFFTLSQLRKRGSGILGPLLASMFVMGSVVFVILVFASRTLYIMIFGSGESKASTETRQIQWDMAWPRILENPITGYGANSSGEVVGFVAPNGMLTVDSYVITILIDAGVPGFIAFFGMIIVAAWVGVRLYLKNPTRETGALMAIASSLIGFGVYRLVLSQTENHTIMFILVAVMAGALHRHKQAVEATSGAPRRGRRGSWPRSRPAPAIARSSATGAAQRRI